MAEVLVDTSVWIDFLRHGRGPAAEALEALLRADRVVLAGPVLAELLRGLRGPREARELADSLAALPCLEIERLDWQRAGELLRALRQRGAEVPLTDALLTALAERHRLAILTLDRHFRILGARLADPLPPGEEEPDPQVG